MSQPMENSAMRGAGPRAPDWKRPTRSRLGRAANQNQAFTSAAQNAIVERQGLRGHRFQTKLLLRANYGGASQGLAQIFIVEKAVEGRGQRVGIGGGHGEPSLLVQGYKWNARIETGIHNRQPGC